MFNFWGTSSSDDKKKTIVVTTPTLTAAPPTLDEVDVDSVEGARAAVSQDYADRYTDPNANNEAEQQQQQPQDNHEEEEIPVDNDAAPAAATVDSIEMNEDGDMVMVVPKQQQNEEEQQQQDDNNDDQQYQPQPKGMSGEDAASDLVAVNGIGPGAAQDESHYSDPQNGVPPHTSTDASPQERTLDEMDVSQLRDDEDAVHPASADEGEIDLDFVEQFDDAFNEYVSRHPDFLITNPDLVHNLRITKLQLLLERQDALEAELLERYEAVKKEKASVELHFQQSLKDAARMKAAREIHLQSHLHELNCSTKAMDAQLHWELLTSSEARAKKQAQLTARLRAQQSTAGTTREDLLQLLPEGPHLDGIRDAILAPPASGDSSTSKELSEQQKNDLRQFEMDNAFLQAEVTVLQKKLAYQKIGAKKYAWVESVLVRMDDKTLKKLKNRYQKKVGVLL